MIESEGISYVKEGIHDICVFFHVSKRTHYDSLN